MGTLKMIAVASVVLAAAVVTVQHGSGSGHAAPLRTASDTLSRGPSFTTLGYEQLATQHVARAVDDSLRMTRQRLHQVAARAASLQRMLDTERVVRDTLVATLDSARRESTNNLLRPSILDASDTRRVTFNMRQAPYTVAAIVDVPPPPDSAHLAMRIAMDPVPIAAKVVCSAPDEHGKRTASLNTSSPPWVTMDVAPLEQSPDFCVSHPTHGTPVRHAIEFRRFMIGGGRSLTIEGKGGWGLFVGSGISWL